MLIRPRLTDFHGINAAQADLDFAIPFFDEDVPLYLDPFMLWRSPSQQDQMLHTGLINAFNHLGTLAKSGNQAQAVSTLILASECDEVGLGTSARRKGKRIGEEKASEIISLFRRIPQYERAGFRHFEEIQLFVDGISKDRVSDIACNFLKSFLIDFTIDQCNRLGVPIQPVDVENVYDYRANTFVKHTGVTLPVNPNDGSPIIFVPRRWLRFVPWLSYEDYFHHYCPQDEVAHTPEELTRVSVLNYNRDHYGVVDAYVKAKERTAADCVNDPLFSQMPAMSARRALARIKKLPTGKTDGADREYEALIGKLLPSMLYPQLDFAQEQARTDDGVSIRDLIFYNTRSTPFLQEMMDDYGSRQITFEIKNVRQIGREHVDQLNRYLADELGRFGVLVTRNPLQRAEMTRTINLWAGQRKAIVVLTDADIEQMVEVFHSKQRAPLEVVLKKYVEFRRECP
ncbi:hypothetical protein OEZ60_21505 [Defluviimonas sp. WL0024]|uniref:Restriction endonuclease n=1 Tax=Albidovulum salinarum TaxID=2984153 RepID=A0ABT2XFY4_9RHOB|nr:hypothetical protein [Defluviimonas sp. WL0024]MCU9850555.1 hypothetical protein [Defluviimonas sp. WL0024]